MEPTISRFLLFLGSELLFGVATLLVAALFGFITIRNRALKNEYAVLTVLLLTVVSVGFMFLAMRILTGENYFWLFTVLTVVSISLILLVELLWLIFGEGNVPWFGRLIWARYEFEQIFPNSNKFLQVCAALTLVIYPVYIGYGYFGDAFGGEDWPRYVLRSTIVVLVGIGWLTQLPPLLYIMTSKNLMEASRSRVFISQLGNSVSALLFLSLFIWTIKGAEATIPLKGAEAIPFLGQYFLFSPTIGYVTLVYLLIIVIIPYLIGHYRAKHWIADLEGKREVIIDNLLTAFMFPNLQEADNTIEQTDKTIKEILERLHEDKAMALAYQIKESRDANKELFRLALQDSVKRHPRFIHNEKLFELLDLLSKCKSELEKKVQEKEKREVLNAFSDLLDRQKPVEKVPVPISKPWVMVGITMLVGTMLNPIISSVVKFFSASLGISG